ncbi:MAG: hypothetical protein Q7T54_05900 [Candidatus Levybacteria bacterium]|nr:hypothetical protein [Candidatus Levybacteria bacterium]
MENEEKIQPIENEVTKPTLVNKLKNKKLLIPLVALFIVLLVGFLVVISAPKVIKPTQNTSTTTATARLSFLSDSVNLTTPTGERTIDFILESATTPLSGLLLYLEYDPQYVQIKKFSLNNFEGSFFGSYAQLVQLGIEQPPGKTTVSLVLPKEVSEKTGKGSIGTFTFSVKNLQPGASTTITVSPNSALINRSNAKVAPMTKSLLITREEK